MRHTENNDKDKNLHGKYKSERTVSNKQQIMNRNSILIIILSVVVVIAAVAGAIVNIGKKSEATGSNGESQVQGESTLNIVENSNELELNKHADVNELIANYRKAFLTGDTSLLQNVYNSDQEINEDILTATSQIIQEYQNTQCYTKRGMNNGEYVVFVYDELKLKDIDTLAPNLSVFYVKTAPDGSLYIYRGDYNPATASFAYDEATQAFINNMYQDADVSELITMVNTKQDSACANDSNLMTFMEKVRNKTNITTAPVDNSVDNSVESSTQSAASETETETNTETDTTNN